MLQLTENNEINFEEILNIIKSFPLNNVQVLYYSPE